MNEAIQTLVGTRVKVWQTGHEEYYYTEEGILEVYDHPWLRLRSDAGDLVLLTAHSIRMLRPAPPRPPLEEEPLALG